MYTIFIANGHYTVYICPILSSSVIAKFHSPTRHVGDNKYCKHQCYRTAEEGNINEN